MTKPFLLKFIAMLSCVFALSIGLLNLNHFASTSYILYEELELINEEKTDTIPEIFAEGVISKEGRYEFGCTLSKDGKEVYFGVDRGGRSEILYSRMKEGKWNEPVVLISDEVYGMNDPMLSPDGNRLYFITNLPKKYNPERNDHDIYYVKKTAQGWSDPIAENKNINTKWDEYYISFTESGTMYFGSNRNTTDENSYNFDIYRSEIYNGDHQKAIALPESVNTPRYEADVYVASDESYIIFCARRQDGYGQGDLYISFKVDEGQWSQSVNMGPLINNEFHQLCPYVSPDGLNFYYTSNKEIMRIDASILKRYK